MKNLFKHFGLPIFILVVTIGCNNSDDNPNNNSTMDPNMKFEELETLSTDMVFIKTIDQLATITYQTSDVVTAVRLAESADELTDSEKLQLAQALGFDSIESNYKAQDEFWESWIDIVNRFGMLSANKKEIARELFVDALMEQEPQQKVSETTFVVSKTKTNDCREIQDQGCPCWDARRACFDRAFDSLFNQTGIECTGDSTIMICGSEMPNRRFTNTFFSRAKRCNYEYNCCLIGYDSADCLKIS